MLRASLLVASIFAVSGCIVPPTSAAKLAESAYDLNNAAVFGRMDIATELVREPTREQFAHHRAAWGRGLRIVDYEMGSVKIRKDGEADVFVVVTWQRVDETTMRTTELSQRWNTARGNWGLVSEEERGGDPGLISELESIKHDDAAPTIAPASRLRFQAHTIYEQ
jgi:hypothetical protein